MAKFLDLEGLNYFWEKIKSWVLERFAYRSDLNQKLDILRSGQNIKTINNLDLLGPGNIEIQGSSSAVNSVNGKTGNVVLSASDVGALSSNTAIPSKTSDLLNDSNFITGYTETDPTVPEWAKQTNKPSYDYSEIGNTPTIPVVPTISNDISDDASSTDKTVSPKAVKDYVDTHSGGGGSGEENLIESISVNGTAQTITNKNVDITVPTTLASLSDDATHRVVTDTDITTWNGKSNFSGSYDDLTNKPTLFSGNYNDLSNKPTIPTVPTDVSAFNNDAGYLTSQDISGKQDIIDSSNKLSADYIQDGTTNKVINVKPDWNAASGADAEILNKPTIPAAGIPSGGNASQVLKKVSATDYDVTWANLSETLPSAYCTTSGSTAAKKANCSLYVAQANQYLQVLIGSANTYQGALTLNINSAGAKSIYINGTVSSSTNYTLPNGTYFVFYDGTNYYFRTDGKIQGLNGTLVCTNSTTGLLKNDGTVDTNTYLTQHQDISGKADKTLVASSMPSGGFLPNVVYNLGALNGNTTFSMAAATDNTIANIWCWTFTTPSTAPTITWPAGITGWSGGSQPTINASKSYEVTVMNGLATIIES